MKNFVKRFLKREPLPLLTLENLDTTIYAVGDVHGRLDLLLDAERRIHAHAERAGYSYVILYLGDLIDRGGDSSGVIDHLVRAPERGFRRLSLRGNHEEMMLSFCSHPDPSSRWLKFGGRETLAAYGIEKVAKTASGIRCQLREAVPAEHLDYLRTLPFGLIFDDIFFAHAGVDPDKELCDQTVKDLAWGVPARLDGAGYPYFLVHGHTPMDRPLISDDRACLDTKAYESGRLTVLAVRAGRSFDLLPPR